MSEKKKLNIESILNNTPEELDIPEFGIVTVRFPSTKEKLEAKKEAMKITDGLEEIDTTMEYARILAIKMMVEPKISLQQYLDGNDTNLTLILDAIHMWYNLKLKDINAKRQNAVDLFLEQMKEK